MVRTPLSAEALHWVRSTVGAASVHSVRRLVGGTHAATDLLQTGDGRELVLRRFPTGDDAVRREERVLGVLDGLGGLAPQLLAADPEGEGCGEPAILTSRLPGLACVTPNDPCDFAGQLGRALARIHAHPGTGLREVFGTPARDAGPVGAEVLGAWDQIADAPLVLTHSDYWSGNTLWRADQLTGVVDWSAAGLAPSGFDVSWCRLDLILLYDRAVADVFATAYQDASGAPVPDLGLWDRYAAMNADAGIEGWAPNYQGLGRVDLGPPTLRQRLRDWTQLLPTGP